MNGPGGNFARRAEIALAILVVAAWLLPVYWLANVALKTQAQLMVRKPTFVFHPTFENFSIAVVQYKILWAALHSLIIAGVATILTLFLALLFVYGVSRFDFRFRIPLLIWTLNLRMLPPIAIVIPFYVFYAQVGLIDTYSGLDPRLSDAHTAARHLANVWFRARDSALDRRSGANGRRQSMADPARHDLAADVAGARRGRNVLLS